MQQFNCKIEIIFKKKMIISNQVKIFITLILASPLAFCCFGQILLWIWQEGNKWTGSSHLPSNLIVTDSQTNLRNSFELTYSLIKTILSRVADIKAVVFRTDHVPVTWSLVINHLEKFVKYSRFLLHFWVSVFIFSTWWSPKV